MLTLALFYAVIFATCMCAGFLFYRLPVFRDALPGKSAAMLFFSGLMLITALIQILCLFLPVNCGVQLSVVVVLAAGCVWQRSAFRQLLRSLCAELRSRAMLHWFVFGVLLLMILAVNAGPTMMDDTDSYHIQMIKWLKEYGTVPGLVHLHSRFGFNSAWFSSVAFFDLQSDHLNYFTALNALTGLVLMHRLCALAVAAERDGNALRLAAAVVLACCLYSWPLFRGNAATANYDYITVAMLVLLCFELVAKAGNTDQPLRLQNSPLPELLLWPVFLFTVRIMNFPLLLLSLFLLIGCWMRNRKLFFTVLAGGIVLVIPFLIRNVILSGYLFYPAMSFDLFPVDWKADPETTIRLQDFIVQYNKISTHYQTIAQTRAMSFGQWFPRWHAHLFSYDRIILYLAIAGLAVTLLLILNRSVRQVLRNRPFYVLFVLVLLLQGIAWFLVAPDPRFYNGPMLCWIAIPLMLGIRGIGRSVTALLKLVTGTMVLGMGIYTFARADNAYLGQAMVVPSRLPQPVMTPVMIGNIRAGRPGIVLENWNPRCYDAELPCIYEIDDRVVPRGSTIAEGFRLSSANK